MASYGKFIAALVGALSQLVAANVVHGAALHYAQVALGVLTALSVLLVPNKG